VSDTSDVKLLTLNTKTVFNTSAAIERVKIHNNSSFFLRVYYGADAPTDPVSGAGWHETIDPGGTPLCEVVGNSAQTFSNRSYVQSTPYQGVITIMPFLPVGATIATGGVLSGASLCYLTAYYPGEWASEGGEIEAFVQAAKQGRYQGVVPGAIASFGLGGFQAQTDQTATNEVQLFQIATLTPTIANNHFLANAAGQSLLNVYLFLYHAELENLSPGKSGIAYTLRFRLMDSTVTITRALIDIAPAFNLKSVNFESATRDLQPPLPLVATLIVPQGALQTGDRVVVSQQRQGGAGIGQYTLIHSIIAAVDYINQSILTEIMPPIGVGLTPAWQTYNPQTY